MSNPQYPPPTSGSSGGNGTLILVLGILSLIGCGILGPVAWIMGNNALPTASPDQAGQINAGRICGIIGTVFLIISIIYLFTGGAAVISAMRHGGATPTHY
ncbi:MAG: alkaline shock response membrane anchor protein AmaP [Armatimonadota bacterium]|nr:alkaline shock response membrane anchor protein AmaP [Armatimonadota bacterium]